MLTRRKSGAEDGRCPSPSYSTTSLSAATESHATDTRNRHLQNLFHKPHQMRHTEAYWTETSDPPKPQDRDNPYLLEADNWLTRVAHKLGLKQKLQWIDSDFFHESAWFSWSVPHSYQIPGWYYSITVEREPNGDKSELKHLDVFRREHEGIEDDRYLDPVDGKVQKLVVRSTKAIYNQRNNTTWRRTYIRNVSPYIIRLAYWPVSSVPSSQESSAFGDERKSHEVIALPSWKKKQWMHVGLRWLPTCIGLLIMVCWITAGLFVPVSSTDSFWSGRWPFPLTLKAKPETMATMTPSLIGSGATRSLQQILMNKLRSLRH